MAFDTGNAEKEAANISIFSDEEEQLESGGISQTRRYFAGLPSVFNAIP